MQIKHKVIRCILCSAVNNVGHSGVKLMHILPGNQLKNAPLLYPSYSISLYCSNMEVFVQDVLRLVKVRGTFESQGRHTHWCYVERLACTLTLYSKAFVYQTIGDWHLTSSKTTFKIVSYKCGWWCKMFRCSFICGLTFKDEIMLFCRDMFLNVVMKSLMTTRSVWFLSNFVDVTK